MLKPSQYRENAEKRIAEIEAESLQIDSPAARYGHQAGAMKALASHFAGIADQERTERILAQELSKSVRTALNVIEDTEADDFSDGQLAALVDFLCSKFATRRKPVAWARKGLGMDRIVGELSQLMALACHEDGLTVEEICAQEFADEAFLMDRAEAEAINERRAA